MKRRVFTILLFLLLGVVVNVGVAWGIAAFGANPDLSDGEQRAAEREEGDSYGCWVILQRERSGSLLIHSDWYDRGIDEGIPFGLATDDPEALVPDWAPQLSPHHNRSEQTYHEVMARMYGWPMLSLGGVLVYEQLSDLTTERYRTIYALCLGDGAFIPAPTSWDDDPRPYHWNQRFLPLRPMWPGFAANSAFYAMTLWFMLCGPFALRRQIRRKRGRCVRCGYDLRSELGAGCPECGWNREEAKA